MIGPVTFTSTFKFGPPPDARIFSASFESSLPEPSEAALSAFPRVGDEIGATLLMNTAQRRAGCPRRIRQCIVILRRMWRRRAAMARRLRTRQAIGASRSTRTRTRRSAQTTTA